MSRARGRGGVVKGERGASCRRFGQRAVLNEGDAEEERARMAGERVVAVGEGDDMGKKEVIDKHLVRLLFQRGAKVAH